MTGTIEKHVQFVNWEPILATSWEAFAACGARVQPSVS